MARPIKETPVLTGRDARRFDEAIKNNENKKVSREHYERAAKTFHSVKFASGNKKTLGT